MGETAENAVIGEVQEELGSTHRGDLKMSAGRTFDEEIKLTYKKLEESDIQKLTLIMKNAFDADTKMHTEIEEDGPAGYDSGELLLKLMRLKNAESNVIYVDGTMAGAYTITKDKDIFTLDMLFIEPSFASKGIGTMVWREIEQKYNEAKTWLVETPDYSKRNHHFYEKCGFEKLREHCCENGEKSIVFVKYMER